MMMSCSSCNIFSKHWKYCDNCHVITSLLYQVATLLIFNMFYVWIWITVTCLYFLFFFQVNFVCQILCSPLPQKSYTVFSTESDASGFEAVICKSFPMHLSLIWQTAKYLGWSFCVYIFIYFWTLQNNTSEMVYWS